MEDIYILGSGGLAKEVYFLIKEINKFDVIAFIDIEEKKNIIFTEKSVPVISEEDFLNQIHLITPKIAIGIGDPILIEKLSIKFNDFDFPNLIHPNVVLDHDNISMGKGNILSPGVIMTTNIIIGDFNIFNLSVTIGHDVKIGNGNVFNPSVNISGQVKIDNSNLFGVGSIVLQEKSIGSNSTLGASALLTKNVEDNIVLVGIPAKKITKTQ